MFSGPPPAATSLTIPITAALREPSARPPGGAPRVRPTTSFSEEGTDEVPFNISV